jgi:hypothetical protein
MQDYPPTVMDELEYVRDVLRSVAESAATEQKTNLSKEDKAYWEGRESGVLCAVTMLTSAMARIEQIKAKL